jgi:hypothetical protein
VASRFLDHSLRARAEYCRRLLDVAGAIFSLSASGRWGLFPCVCRHCIGNYGLINLAFAASTTRIEVDSVDESFMPPRRVALEIRATSWLSVDWITIGFQCPKHALSILSRFYVHSLKSAQDLPFSASRVFNVVVYQ